LMSATLTHLVRVRAPLAESVLDFLRQLTEGLDVTPWVWRGGARLRASESAIKPFVLTREGRPKAGRLRPGREEPDRGLGQTSPLEELEAAR
jgi:hypothetical protein